LYAGGKTHGTRAVSAAQTGSVSPVSMVEYTQVIHLNQNQYLHSLHETIWSALSLNVWEKEDS